MVPSSGHSSCSSFSWSWELKISFPLKDIIGLALPTVNYVLLKIQYWRGKQDQLNQLIDYLCALKLNPKDVKTVGLHGLPCLLLEIKFPVPEGGL